MTESHSICRYGMIVAGKGGFFMLCYSVAVLPCFFLFLCGDRVSKIAIHTLDATGGMHDCTSVLLEPLMLKDNTQNRVAVKELNLSCYIGETLLFPIYIYIYMVTAPPPPPHDPHLRFFLFSFCIVRFSQPSTPHASTQKRGSWEGGVSIYIYIPIMVT